MIRIIFIVILANIFVSAGEAKVHKEFTPNGYVLMHKRENRMTGMVFRRYKDCQRYKKAYMTKLERVQYKCAPVDPD